MRPASISVCVGDRQTHSDSPDEAHVAYTPAYLGPKMPVPFIPLQVGIQAIAWIHINSAGAGLRPPSVPAYHVKKFWL